MKRTMKYLPLLITVLLLLCGPALADSREITRDCRFKATVNPTDVFEVMTDNYSTYWTGQAGEMKIRLPEKTSAQGIHLSFFMEAVPVTVEALDASGNVIASAEYSDRYLNAWIPLVSESAYRVCPTEEKALLRLSRVRVYSGDTIPQDAQIWHEPEGPADLLLIVTHPDDDLIWFGGLLPTYAGERGINVVVACAATQGAMKVGRLNEFLDGEWVCGVTNYPVFGPFADFQAKSVQAVTKRWGKNAMEAWCTGLIRRFKPKVVVTQDLRGESGHMQHKVLAAAVAEAVTAWCGDPAKDPESAAEYGVYVPQKLYIHRYRQNEIFMDWNEPLASFGGESSAQVAHRAFKKHVSQRNTHYRIYMGGPLDSRYLGLYFSSVGDDVLKNDLFEHVVTDSPGENAGSAG